MVDLKNLAAEIHEAAVKRGFWDIEDAEEKHLAKMISELGEAVQADRAGVMYEIERDGAKPEGVVAELADFVMMALDYAAQIDAMDSVMEGRNESERADAFVASNYKEIGSVETISGIYAAAPAYKLVLAVAADTAEALGPLGTREDLFKVLGVGMHLISAWCKGRGYDLWEVIREKMAYNESRPALHGRKY